MVAKYAAVGFGTQRVARFHVLLRRGKVTGWKIPRDLGWGPQRCCVHLQDGPSVGPHPPLSPLPQWLWHGVTGSLMCWGRGE